MLTKLLGLEYLHIVTWAANSIPGIRTIDLDTKPAVVYNFIAFPFVLCYILVFLSITAVLTELESKFQDESLIK